MQRLLRICEEIEKIIAQIYRHWQDVFSDDKSLSGLWSKLADDELDHVRQVQLAARVVNENVLESGEVSLESLEKSLSRARQLLKEVQEKDVSKKTALQAAIKIEDEFMKAHLLNATRVTDPSMRSMFNSLARADEEHVKTLQDYCDSFFAED